MWTTFLGCVTKYLLPAVSGMCIVLVCICIYLYSSNEGLVIELANANSKLTTLVQVAENERLTAKHTIELQNSKIDKYQIDLDDYTKIVNEKEKALIEARVVQQQQLDKELSVDSSSDNQLKIMTKVMKDFSNGL